MVDDYWHLKQHVQLWGAGSRNVKAVVLLPELAAPLVEPLLELNASVLEHRDSWISNEDRRIYHTGSAI
ncbi:MAG: hypothetical protein ACERLB_04975 [Gammaproteobacteria bacterium]